MGNTNKYNIDAITMLNGFSYLSYMYFQGETKLRSLRLPNLRPVLIFLILRGYTSLKEIRRECGASEESIKAELTALLKDGYLEKRGSAREGRFLPNKEKCEEILILLYKRANAFNRIYFGEDAISDPKSPSYAIISGVEALFSSVKKPIKEEYRLGEAVMCLYVFQKKLLTRNRSFSELMILYYLSTLKSVNTFRTLHRIMPHQSVSNIRECCTRLRRMGYALYKEQSSALWGEEGERIRKEKVIFVTEEGLKVLKEEQEILNEAMNSLTLNKTQEAGLRQIIKTSLSLENRAYTDPALPEKPERRKNSSPRE